MGAYLRQRVISLIPLLLLVAVIAFVLVRLTPGDPAAVAAGEDATVTQIAQMRHQMGLDRPIPVQFASWLGRVFLHGDLGESLAIKQPVLTLIKQRIEPTLLVAIFGGFVAISLGIPLGVFAAIRHNTWLDRVLMVLAIVGLSVPGFWLGLILVLVFSLNWRLLPPAGFESLADGGFSALRYIILPGVAIGVSNAAFLARIVRSSMLDVLRQDYIRTAYAKGLAGRRVIVGHVIRNAMMAPLTVIGLLMANLISGTIVIEVVFNIPGAGRLLVTSVARRDYPVMQGAILVTGLIYILVNLAVDILYAFVDPRIGSQR